MVAFKAALAMTKLLSDFAMAQKILKGALDAATASQRAQNLAMLASPYRYCDSGNNGVRGGFIVHHSGDFRSQQELFRACKILT